MNYMLAPLLPKNQLKNRALSPKGVKLKKEAERVISIVSAYYGILDKDLKGKCRKRELVFPRQLCISFLTNEVKMTLRDAGIMLGRRDHTTARHARKTISNLVFSDEDIRHEVEEVLNKIKTVEIIHQ